jgi:hypothetical protein
MLVFCAVFGWSINNAFVLQEMKRFVYRTAAKTNTAKMQRWCLPLLPNFLVTLLSTAALTARFTHVARRREWFQVHALCRALCD